MENTDNPYMITVHYVMEENHENRLKSIIPFNDHITCWFDMYKNTLE